MNCGKIAKNLTLAGCGASIAGIAPELILLNFDDIDKSSSSISGNVLSTIVMSGSAKGYKYESAKNAFEGSVSLNKGTYVNTYNHQLLGRVFAKTQNAKDELIKLAQGKVVAVVKNLDATNQETVYEAYGWDAGLVMSDFQAASTDADGVLYTFTLASDDNAKESELPKSVYSETLAATETMLKGLVVTS